MQAFQAIPQSVAHRHHEIGINVAEACLHVPEMGSGTGQTEGPYVCPTAYRRKWTGSKRLSSDSRRNSGRMCS
jgi:hypothetical protein